MTQLDRDGVCFDLPPDWSKQTIVAFSGPLLSTGGRANLVVTNQPNPKGMSLDTYASRRMIELGTTLVGFEIRESGATTVSGLSGIRHEIVWLADSGWLDQTMVFVAREIDHVPTVTVITTTLPADVPTAEADAARQSFARLVASVSFRDDSRAHPRSETVPRAAPADEASFGVVVPMPGIRRG